MTSSGIEPATFRASTNSATVCPITVITFCNLCTIADSNDKKCNPSGSNVGTSTKGPRCRYPNAPPCYITRTSCLVNIEPITICYTIDSTIWFLRQKSLSLPSVPETKDIIGVGWTLFCDVLFLVYIRTFAVASVILYIKEWSYDLWVMMWKNYERKWSLSNLRNYRGLGLEAMWQVTKTLRQDGWSPVRDLNWALTHCRARNMAPFCSHVVMRIVSRNILPPSARYHKDISVHTILTWA